MTDLDPTPQENSRHEIDYQRVDLPIIKLDILESIWGYFDPPYPTVLFRIMSAQSVDALWDLRVDLFRELSKLKGNHIAHSMTVSISNLFFRHDLPTVNHPSFFPDKSIHPSRDGHERKQI